MKRKPSVMSQRLLSPWFIIFLMLPHELLRMDLMAWQEITILLLQITGYVLTTMSSYFAKSPGDEFLDECARQTMNRNHRPIPDNK